MKKNVITLIVICIVIISSIFIIKNTIDRKRAEEKAKEIEATVAEIINNSNYLGEEYCIAYVTKASEPIYSRRYKFYLNNNDNILYCILNDSRIYKITNENDLNKTYMDINSLITDLINTYETFDENEKTISRIELKHKLESVIQK